MGLSHSPRIVTDGLVLCLDAANKRSYPGAGTAWTDLKSGSVATLVNGPQFYDTNGGYLSFDGTNEQCNVSTTTPSVLQGNPSFTVVGWFKRNGTISARSTWGFGGDSGGEGFTSWNYNQPNNISIDLWGAATYTSGQTYSLTEFKHCAWCYTGGGFSTSSVTIYVNAIPYTGSDLSILRGGSSTHTPNINNNGIVLGKSSIAESQWGRPDIANFNIYSRVLSAEEIRQNYLATKGRYA